MVRILCASLLLLPSPFAIGCYSQAPWDEDPPSGGNTGAGNGTETGATPDTGTTPDTEDGAETDSGWNSDRDTGPPYDRLGVCGVSGEARVTPDDFVGYEEHYLIGDEGLGDDQCRVRYALSSVGYPEVPCEPCTWAFVLQQSNAEIIADVDGACAGSELRLDEAAIADMNGKQVLYGYAPEYIGHANVLMRYNGDALAWEAVTFAVWDDISEELDYDRRDGYCGY